jgi:indole-3-glycerol phosphate synthase
MIVARRRDAVRRDRQRVGMEEMRQKAGSSPNPRSLAGAARACTGLFVIAELKRASPSAGPLRPDLDAAGLATAYREGGAGAVSVLTEPEFFQAHADDLIRVRAAVDLPVLRKDFIVDEYQVYESRALGADAVLLIVAALEAGELQRLIAVTEAAGMEALVEVHDEAEVDLAIAAGAGLIGVNNRNLATLEVDIGVSLRIAERIPDPVVRIAESGLRTRADLESLRRVGYAGFLIGETLVRAADPGSALRELIG